MPIDPHTLDSATWQRGEVTWRHAWPGGDGLVSLRIGPQVAPRLAGQYIKLACSDDEGAWGMRYLSVASAPNDEVELLVAPPKRKDEPGDPSALQIGDEVIFSRAGSGRLVLPDSGGHTLWLLAAGTGLAPLLSVCRAGNSGFSQVVVVHCARNSGQHAWADELQSRADSGEIRYLSLQTRNAPVADAKMRIPPMITSGQLFEMVGLALDTENDAAMVCGSGKMIGDTRAALEAAGLPTERVITEF
ncbi:MAG: hypothetical protein KC502_15885 [Myxococcales bacterium]|nr:hypothetical protein [Myxococcales bacterium]